MHDAKLMLTEANLEATGPLAEEIAEIVKIVLRQNERILRMNEEVLNKIMNPLCQLKVRKGGRKKHVKD